MSGRQDSPRKPGWLSGAARAWLIVGLAVLSGCQQRIAPTAPARLEAAAQESRQLWGRISDGRAVQAAASDLMPYATVTLLDATHAVVATGLTDANGTFGLNPFVSWTPTTNAVYALDAVKSFDGTNDRAVMRLRTLVSWDGTQWKSLSGTTHVRAGGAGVVLSARTTALAAIKDLRALSATSLLGALDPNSGVFTPTADVTPDELDTVAGMVTRALSANLDPMQWVTYSAGTYGLSLGPKAGRVLFDLEEALAIRNGANARATLVAGRDGGTALAFSDSTAVYDTSVGTRGTGPAHFINPNGVAVDRYGNLYASDRNNDRYQKFSPDLRYLWSLANVGSGVGALSNPHSIDLDPSGAMLLADYANSRILKLDAQGNLLFGIGNGSSGWKTAPAVVTGGAFNQLNGPHVARFDPAGNIWVSDYANHRLLKYDPNGTFLLGIGNGQVWTTSAGSQTASGSANAAFNGPMGFAFTPSGDVYVCDRLNNRIQRFASNGTYKGKWGTKGTGPGQIDGAEDLALDNAGNLWVTEYYGDRVQKFNPDGTYLGTFGATGAGPGQFSMPRNLSFAPDGGLFVADEKNNRIQRFVPTNSAMQFPAAGNFETARGTVEFWFKPLRAISEMANRTLFACDNNGTLRLVTRFGSLASDGLFIAAFDKYGDDSRIRRAGLSGQDALRLVQKGRWHHMAATWVAASAELRFYLDGVEYTSYSIGATPSFNFGPPRYFVVGADHSSDYLPADSVIDQFRLYDYAKSPSEIARDARGVVQE